MNRKRLNTQGKGRRDGRNRGAHGKVSAPSLFDSDHKNNYGVRGVNRWALRRFLRASFCFLFRFTDGFS